MLDLVQVLLQQEGWLSWLACVLLVMVLVQGFKLVAVVWRSSWWLFQNFKKILVRWSWRSLTVVAVVASLLWLVSEPTVELLQEVEQAYFRPVFVNEYSSVNEEHLTAIYEAELARNTDPYECEVIKRRTREMAARIQSTPLAIYECAYLECGLKPFTVRRDEVAAGWIQFTRVGLGGLRYEGQSVPFERVLQACHTRDADFVMNLSEIYLTDKYERAGRRPLNNTIDLYLALFAPALIGAPHDRVVYQGWQNPSYYLNSGLDGWYVVPVEGDKQQIFRKKSACDGKITIWEMYLALEAKKDHLMERYLR